MMPGSEQLSFKAIFSRLTSAEMERAPAEAMQLSEAKNAIARNEVVAKVISTVLGLAVSFTFTYFGVKWLVNAMDPTRKEKQEAQARVSLGLFFSVHIHIYVLCMLSRLHFISVEWL